MCEYFCEISTVIKELEKGVCVSGGIKKMNPVDSIHLMHNTFSVRYT